MSLLARSGWRHLARHPWQLVLAVFGVALGVAVVVAVDLANESAERAFRTSMETVSGRASHQIVGGPGGLDDQLYTRLRAEAGIRAVAPVIEAYGTVASETLHLLGIDPFAEASFRGHLQAVEGVGGDRPMLELLTEPDTVLMAGTTARRLGLRPGDAFEMELAGRRQQLQLVGLLEPPADAQASVDGLALTDIASAQEMLGYRGRLSWIDVDLSGVDGGARRAAILQRLPASASLVPAEGRTNALAQMTRAFRTNLTAMSLLALVVGMFLIYNTMTFAVLQRRKLTGALRVLGVTPAEVFRQVMGEALLIAAVGTALGLALGVALGQALVELVTQTVNDLYFVVNVRDPQPSLISLAKGLALGIGATLLASAIPAWEAASTPPRLTLSRATLERRVRAMSPWLAALGALLAVAAVVVLRFSGTGIVAGFVALFLVILGLTLMTPLITTALARWTALPLGRVLGVQARLAVNGVTGSLSRTGVAVAALMLAVATTVGVGVMVQSFRTTVATWLDATLQADVYVAAPSLMTSRTDSRLPPTLAQELGRLEGVAAAASARRVTIESGTGMTELLAVELPRDREPRYRLKQGQDSTWRRFREDRGVLVSEPYAYHNRIGTGDRVELRTDRGTVSLPVLGVYYDYGSDQGTVLVHRALYDRLFDDRAISSLGLYLKPGTSVDAIRQAINARIPDDTELVVRSTRDIREASLTVFDRTFTITGVLRLLTVVVAFVGILSALMALQLERRREVGVLRATGMTPGQIGAMVGVQTGFMGLVSGLLAIPTGLVLAVMLVDVINLRSFGWTMDLAIPMEVLSQALALAVVAALLAGLYPGWKLARTSPAEALREE